MPSVFTLSGSKKAKNANLGEPTVGVCKTVFNPRTKQCFDLCFVGKSSKHRSGWVPKKGSFRACKR
jgi:hypothetical protein